MSTLTRGSMLIVAAATLMGLFFGNAINGLLGAVILGAISLAGSLYAVTRYESGATTGIGAAGIVQDPPLARFLFQDARAAALWLPVRLFIGWDWLEAGFHKFQNPAWIDTGTALQGYWTKAVAVSDAGTGPITYEWWRVFLQGMLDAQAYTWFAKLIVFGEIAIGLGLIVGALVGVAAFFGALLNVSFLLSGSTSTNPIMLLSAFALVLAWKVAGHIGLDRVLLPILGTPWQPGKLVHRTEPTSSSGRQAPQTR